MELLLRGKGVFCVLPTGFDKSLIAELLARAKRAQSGAPWVRKFGKLSI